jgi:hypothetical protein
MTQRPEYEATADHVEFVTRYYAEHELFDLIVVFRPVRLDFADYITDAIALTTP